MADEVPAKGKRASRENLALTFLHLVFPEVDLARCSSSADGVDGKRLGDRDETDGGGLSVGPESGARDAIADAVQPGRDVGR